MVGRLEFDFGPTLRDRRRIEDGYRRAEHRAIADTTRAAEQALEGATASAGLGRLSKAWASKIMPERGALPLAGLVYPKGGRRTRGAMAAHARGARIRSRDGGPVAIPLPAAGPRGRGREITPEEWERRTGQKLRLVVRRGKAPLLVADGRVNARSGRFRPRLKRDARRQGPGIGATVPIFVLMPEVTIRASLSFEQVLAPFPGRLAGRFLELANEVK